jgi:diguanylate cyclase (GGDEF)-like protein
MKLLQQKRIKWLIWGLSLSFLGPLGEWVLLSIFALSKEDSLFFTYIYTEIAALIAFGSFGYFLGSYADRIEKLAITDKLTGLFNRHFIMDRLGELLKMQQRYKEFFSLILLDLDYFKKVNDMHGHVIGDRTLKAIAETISKEVRDTDHPCRFGGEEFLVLCPHTNIEEACNLAERIRLKVALLGKSELGFSGTQTISAGVYEVTGSQELSSTEVLSKLDEALYRAKTSGRNRVEPELQTTAN